MDTPVSSIAGSQTLLRPGLPKELPGSEEQVQTVPTTQPWYKKRSRVALLALGALVLLILIIILPVYFTVIKKSNTSSSPSSASGSTSSGSGSSGKGGGGGGKSGSGSTTLTTGGNGSTVTTSNGTQFTYLNPFGGFWVDDPSDPFNDNAQPNSWTPPLNTTWDWSTNKIYGVNLGGLFVLEPFITPDMFQRYQLPPDEYTLSTLMRQDTANGGINQIEAHYQTFITEEDLAQIAGAGLNWIRLPVPFWAIETWDGEPYLEGVSWKYILQVLGWARKYGLRVCIDLHTVPGSQNGYNHSGKFGSVNFLNGNMGLANAQRALYYIRIFTEFFSQPEYRNVIAAFEILNEPLGGTIGMEAMHTFYVDAYTTVRNITGYGEGNGPYIVLHDAFQGLNAWEGFLDGADRVILDTHPYLSFDNDFTSPITDDADDGLPGGIYPAIACNTWGSAANASMVDFGVTIAGEFSATPNDCGLFIDGVSHDSFNPECPEYNDWQNYNDTMKEGIQNFVIATMDAVTHWFFWTWKIGPSADSGEVEAPLWSYQLGLMNGWLPADPRVLEGKCAALGATDGGDVFDGTFEPEQTGAVSTDSVEVWVERYPWPPATLSNIDVDMALLPTYTATGSITTLSPDASATQSMDGWFDAQDTQQGIITVAGCTYPSEYDGSFTITPTAACTGPTS